MAKHSSRQNDVTVRKLQLSLFDANEKQSTQPFHSSTTFWDLHLFY